LLQKARDFTTALNSTPTAHTAERANRAKEVWREGDELISAALRAIAEAYEELAQPRPVVVVAAWTRHEEAVEAAYAARDQRKLEATLDAYETFARQQWARRRPLTWPQF
jgi:hypothetical protein